MKILHTVQLYHPAVGGSEEAVKQLSERLVKRGHQVTVATAFHPQRKNKVLNGVKIEEFQISGNRVKGITAEEGEIKRFQDFILNSDFDIIMNYAAQIWSSDLVFPLLDKIKAKKFFVPCGYSALNNPKYRAYFKKLPDYLRQYEACIYLSKTYQDKLFADDHCLVNSIIIPNAANEDEFLKKDVGNFKAHYNIKNDFLLSVANYYSGKGHHSVIKAYRLSEAKKLDLVIIGNAVRGGCQYRCKQAALFTKLLSLGKKRIHLLSQVPREYAVSAYKQAKLFLFASKVECSPLVLFEAMAAKLPFISTNCGNSLELAKMSKNKIVATPKQMAEEIDYLLNNPEVYNEIADHSFKVWQRKFTWEKIVSQYERLYQPMTSISVPAEKT